MKSALKNSPHLYFCFVKVLGQVSSSNTIRTPHYSQYKTLYMRSSQTIPYLNLNCLHISINVVEQPILYFTVTCIHDCKMNTLRGTWYMLRCKHQLAA